MSTTSEPRRATPNPPSGAKPAADTEPPTVSAATPTGHRCGVADSPVGAGYPASTAPTGNQPRTWTIEIPPGTPLNNANDRGGWQASFRRGKKLRTIAKQLAEITRIPACSRVRVDYVVRPLTHGPFDPGNWAPSVKPCVDGLVDAGVIPDDSSQYLEGPYPKAGEPVKPNPAQRKLWRHGQLILVITDVGGEA